MMKLGKAIPVPLPRSTAKIVILHWTAGGHKASDLDKAHYHFLVEVDGRVVPGLHSVADNDSTADGDYAAHTKGLNTDSIGIAACCMLGAVESPFSAGTRPMSQIQWERMLDVAAECCKHYGIKVTPQTVLAHGEVEKILGVPQLNKWDPLAWPWDTKKTKKEIGDEIRFQVKYRSERPDCD